MAEAPKKSRLTLYEELLSEDTIAQMKAKDAAVQADEAKKKSNASLMFKPTNLGKKTTTAKNQQPKPKPSFASIHKSSSSTSSSTVISAPPATAPTANTTEAHQPQQAKPGQKRGFNEWLADEDEEWQYYEKPKYERGGKKKKKKKNNQQFQEQRWSWDDIYDPTVPVNFLEYPRSEVRFEYNDAWKERLHAANRAERQRRERTASRRRSDEDGDFTNRSTRNTNFAPPSSLSFAPPAEHNLGSTSSSYPMESSPPQQSRPPTPLQPVCGAAQTQVPTVAAKAPKVLSAADAEKAALAAAQIAAMKAKMAASRKESSETPPAHSSLDSRSPARNATVVPGPPSAPHSSNEQGTPKTSLPDAPNTITAAPTYNPEYFAKQTNEDLPTEDAASQTQDSSEVDDNEARSNRPGQAGFAERMLKKMGWEKGQGLGKTGDGITTAIVAKAEKRKKLPDAAGGGFAAPANMGKIVGGKKKSSNPTEEAAAIDKMYDNPSDVIKLGGMLKGMDVDREIQENNLLQEIGDEMGEFGKVERLFIWREHMGGNNDVFVKFTSTLSGLRAVKAMDGTEFAGNQIKAEYWDWEKFEKGEYV